MTCCSHCEDAQDLFSARAARRDLKRFRKRGPSRTTRLLLEALEAQRSGDSSLLDIGGGVGAISHELLEGGFERGVQVDASPAYLAASEEEAARRGHADRMTYHYGDFVELAATLGAADVVTLDRVVCCYPDMEALVTASTARARHLYGLVLPRERLATRVGVACENLMFRLRGSAFRTFVHPPELVDAFIRRAGFRRTYAAGTALWQVLTYART